MAPWHRMKGYEYEVKLKSGIIYIHRGGVLSPIFMKGITFVNRGANSHPQCM